MGHPANSFRAAVITFPGSNCDRDMAVAIEMVTGVEALRVWHGDADLPEKLDFIALPGGFSYGDYLRSGAMAARSPVLRAVVAAAERGVPVLGVCNGFQVLTESGLLPGALMRNAGQRFVCRTVELEVANTTSPFTSGYQAGDKLRIPVAHHDGNYFADESTLDILEGEGRVAFRYTENPNGSRRDIAGVLSANGRVLGMMPHPERAMKPAAHASMGGADGRGIFENLVRNLIAA
jgi:phosphoribosylformylglycinamidine synthase